MPLVHPPGELAQDDFVEVCGVRLEAWRFLMRWLHAGRDFAMLCARQGTTWFLAAHVAAFAHFADVVAEVVHDTLTAAVARVVRGEGLRNDGRGVACGSRYPRFTRRDSVGE